VAPEKLKAVEIVDKFQAQVGEFGLIIVCVARPGFRALKVPKANALRDASRHATEALFLRLASPNTRVDRPYAAACLLVFIPYME